MNLLLIAALLGQCGPGGCPSPVLPVDDRVVSAEPEWRSFGDDTDQVALYVRGRQVGNYRYSTGKFRDLNPDGSWGQPRESSIRPPERNQYFGVIPHKLGLHGDGYWHKGVRVDRDRAFSLIEAGGGQLPDDAGKLALTLVGPAEVTKKVLADLAGLPLRDKVKVQTYTDASHWHLKGFKLDQSAGYQASKFVMFLTSAAGKELLKVYDPHAAVEELRKVDPNYDPNKPAGGGGLPFASIPAEAWAVGILALLAVVAASYFKGASP